MQIFPAANPGIARGHRPEHRQVAGRLGLVRPMRDDARQVNDVAVDELMLGEIGLVVGRVGAHDVDHRRVGPPRVVEIREAVGETAAHMQQRESGLARHARISVGRAGHHVLFQAENGAHVFGPPHFVNELHLGRAGIGETGVEPCVGEGFEQCLCSIHNHVLSLSVYCDLPEPHPDQLVVKTGYIISGTGT